MEPAASFDLTRALASWLDKLAQDKAFQPDDLAELESHLLDQIDELVTAGTPVAAAFRIATSQLGNPEELGGEFGKVNRHYRRLWLLLTQHRGLLTAKKIAAFSVLFVALTFSSIFGGPTNRKPVPVRTGKTLPIQVRDSLKTAPGRLQQP